MRINKYIASAGVTSRRKADELITEGNVKVNGAVIRTPGYDVKEGDIVQVNGRVVEASEELVYYALNKPPGFVTTVSDDRDRPTVMDLLTDVTVRVFPVGRLDYDSAGLLIMTNDGSLGQHIAHPSHKVWKTYLAEINGPITQAELQRLCAGVVIDGRRTAPADAELLKQNRAASLVQIKIHEGRNRQVRKMFEAVGYKVTYLQRTQIGNIRLGRLKEGGYRKLTKEEIEYLKNC